MKIGSGTGLFRSDTRRHGKGGGMPHEGRMFKGSGRPLPEEAMALLSPFKGYGDRGPGGPGGDGGPMMMPFGKFGMGRPHGGGFAGCGRHGGPFGAPPFDPAALAGQSLHGAENGPMGDPSAVEGGGQDDPSSPLKSLQNENIQRELEQLGLGELSEEDMETYMALREQLGEDDPEAMQEFMSFVQSLRERQGAGQEGAAPQGGAPEGAAPQGTAPEGAAPQGGAPEGAAPQGGAPQGGAPEGAAPQGAAPEGAAPPGAAPEGAAPQGSAPEGAAPQGASPQDGQGPEGGGGNERAAGALDQQKKMDREQEDLQMASQVEAKIHQTIMAIIANIR